jgi:hypothetical protein
VTFDARYRPAFDEALAALERAAANLAFTLERTAGLLPLTAVTAAALAPEARERLDALATRFARCQQMAGQAFKALSLVEAEPQSRFIDLLAMMQKRGLIDDIETWNRQRDLRNDTGHVYFATDAEFAAFHSAMVLAAPAVIDYARRLREYAAGIGL